jgi:hypothetical protein
MIRINLAPEYIPESNPLALYFGMAVFLVVVGAAYYGPVYYSEKITAESTEIRAKTEEKRGQLSKLKLDVERINSLRAKLADVKNRSQRIRVLGADRKQPILFLDKMQAVHLDKMWLTSLEVKSATKKEGVAETGVATPDANPVASEVIVKGSTFDHSVVSEYAKRIKNEFQNAGIESANGFKDYVPPFLSENEEEDAEVDNETMAYSKKIKNFVKTTPVTPVLIREIILKESKSEQENAEKKTVPITTFEFSLNTNMQMD